MLQQPPSACGRTADLTLPHPSSQLLLICGWRALTLLDECSVFNSIGCVRNWPLIPMKLFVVRYYNAELGWYLHLMLKHSLGERQGRPGARCRLGSTARLAAALLAREQPSQAAAWRSAQQQRGQSGGVDFGEAEPAADRHRQPPAAVTHSSGGAAASSMNAQQLHTPSARG